MASATTYHPPLAPTEIQRQIPSVGAVCGKAARTALCGGCEVTCVPTATAWHNGSTYIALPWRLCPRGGGATDEVGVIGTSADAWAKARFETIEYVLSS